MKRLFCGCVLAIIVIFSCISAEDVHANTFDVRAENAILLDAETGKILFEKNAKEPLPPASMTKIMSAYLIMDAIDSGQLSWDTTITTSTNAHRVATLDGPTRVFLADGETRSVEQLFTALAVYSAADATVSLTEAVAGSEAAFVERMNEKAAELGMESTHFVNATGLNNQTLGDLRPTGDVDDENIMSAYDTAILSRAFIEDYPEAMAYFSIPEKDADFINIHIENWNWMIDDHPSRTQYAYEGVDGLKTGYTSEAGYCFAGTAVRDDRRLISVVMGTESEGDRFDITRSLLDYGFNQFRWHDVLEAGDTVDEYEAVPVARGRELEIELEVGEPLQALLRDDEEYRYDVALDTDLLNADGELEAPIEAGTVIGTIQLDYDEDEYGFLSANVGESSVLVAATSVEEAGWFRLMLRAIGDFFSNIWDNIFGSDNE